MNYEWPSMFKTRKGWRRRKWVTVYWVSYGFYNFKLNPFGTHYYVIAGKNDIGSSHLLMPRKMWGVDRRITRYAKEVTK